MSFITSNRQRGALLVAIGALLVVVGAIGAISAGVGAAEPVNSSVEVGNYTDAITAQVSFNGTISDANATADYTIQDPTGTEWATGTLAGNASETVLEEVDVTDSDAHGNYSVVVTADAGVVDSGIAGTLTSEPGGGGGSGGVAGMSTTQLGALAVLALVVGAALLREP